MPQAVKVINSDFGHVSKGMEGTATWNRKIKYFEVYLPSAPHPMAGQSYSASVRVHKGCTVAMKQEHLEVYEPQPANPS